MKYYSVKTYTKLDSGLNRLLYCSFVRENSKKEALELHQKEFSGSLNCDGPNMYNVVREVSNNKRFAHKADGPSLYYKYIYLKDMQPKESGVLASNKLSLLTN